MEQTWRSFGPDDPATCPRPPGRGDGSFMEADHLGGDTDVVAIEALLEEQGRRHEAGDCRWRIPCGPIRRIPVGHGLLDDIGKPTHPGYPAIGRLKGLAELRGVMLAVPRLRGLLL